MAVNKKDVFAALLEQLRADLGTTVKASKDAANYATDEQSKAESKWDTQGLEASYLAAGQANYAHERATDIQKLMSMESELVMKCDSARLGALTYCDLGGFKEWFYLAPVGGGQVLKNFEQEITVISPNSPIYQALYHKEKGQPYTMPNGSEGKLIELY